MALDNTARDANGHTGSPRRFRLARPPAQPQPGRHGDDQGRRLAGLTNRQLRRAPGVPGSWARFLIAHVRWIVVVTLAAVAAAALLAFSQTRYYKSEAVVNVQPAAASASSGNPPNMATEEGIVTSGTVLGRAARSLHVPLATLAGSVSVAVPGTTTLLYISYSDPVPRVAQQRAQAIALAYLAYRPVPPPVHGNRAAKALSLRTTPSAVLVTPALLPTSPSSPKYLIDIGAALIVGLALAIGTAGLRDYLDDHLRGPLDLEAQADAPVLTLIPGFWTGRGGPPRRLVMVTSPGSVVAEAYRGLRTRLVQAAIPRQATTLLVTSPGWEDKGTVAANLAAALAQSGRGVVLVCADLRWGRAQELFGRRNGGGLSGLLEGRSSLLAALQATGVPGLRLLPPGAVPADPGALLQHPAWHTTLSEIRMRADVVVIEAPPLLASPDVQPIADLAEMIVIVTDARRTTRAQVRAAAREVEPVRDKLAGYVLTGLGRRRYLRTRRPTPALAGPAAGAGAPPDRSPLEAVAGDGTAGAGVPENGAAGLAVPEDGATDQAPEFGPAAGGPAASEPAADAPAADGAPAGEPAAEDAPRPAGR